MKRAAGICGWVLVGLGALVLIGWATDSTLLKEITADWPEMKAVTAVAFVLTGLAIVLLAGAAPGQRSVRYGAGLGCAALTAASGLAVLIEHAAGDLGMNSPSLLTGAATALVGGALLTIDLDPPRYRPGIWLLVGAGCAAMAALVGWAYDVDYLKDLNDSGSLALHTALGLALAVVATALARPDRGPIEFLRGDDPTSTVVRRLAPLAIILPLGLGAVRIAGEDAGWFSADTGGALVTLGSIGIIAGVIFVSARGMRAQALRGDRGERRLAESARHFELINDLVATCGFDGYFKHLNGAWRQTLGWEPSEMLSRPFLEFVHPDDRAAVEAEVAKLERGGTTAEFKIRIATADGGWRWCEWSASPDLGAAAFVCVGREITGRIEADRLKDEFLGLVSHELRTPLTSIIGYTELLAEVEAENLSDQGRRFIDVIERNSQRELDLVGDLLLLSRITAGTFAIEVEPMELNSVIRAAVEGAAPDARKAGIEVRCDLNGVPPIEGDPDRLGQVVDNLLSNAIKFTPDGGRISITSSAVGDAAAVAVADTGIGISRADSERLFERTYRAPEAARRHIQGTGLGLTIAKAIVDAHGGSISVESEPGSGTVFTVLLPCAGADAAPLGK